jgi:hypothetical protein
MNPLRWVLPACAFVFVSAACASAEWRPPDLRPTTATRAEVLSTYVRAAGAIEPRFAQRRERWTYLNGSHRMPVDVTVRGADFRAALALGPARYSAGRSEGVRWRADANGIAHATLSDDQGDALDRLSQSIFPFSPADCELAGESNRFAAAWVLVDRAPRDKPHWFYVDKATGTIAHEVTREGGRTVVTAFEAFDAVTGAQRPRHWRVSDGDAANDLDVTVDSIVPETLREIDVAIPQTRRTFAAADPPATGVVRLPAAFMRSRIVVDVDLDGQHMPFILDTGTASITLDAKLAERRGWGPVLEHATVPRMTAGALALSDVSTLAIPFGPGGLLGYDFFVGHVVHIDYAHAVVEVLTADAARPAFVDPASAVVAAYFDEGVPLVRAAFGDATGERFVLDSGSPSLYVTESFARRYAGEIAAHWGVATFPGGRTRRDSEFLEGSIGVTARRAAQFTLGPWRFDNAVVGVQEPNPRPDALDLMFDGIVGTDQMALFEWWFDYDGGRIAMRRNSLR